MLRFPGQIREKDGLRMAQALRDGAESRLREALARQVPVTPEDEAALIADVLAALDAPSPDPRKGGRPRRASGPKVVLGSGVVIEAQQDARGWSIRLGSAVLDRSQVERLVEEIGRTLERLG